jgi:hypothetical protein
MFQLAIEILVPLGILFWFLNKKKNGDSQGK